MRTTYSMSGVDSFYVTLSSSPDRLVSSVVEHLRCLPIMKRHGRGFVARFFHDAVLQWVWDWGCRPAPGDAGRRPTVSYRLHGSGAAVIMVRKIKQRAYPHDSTNPPHKTEDANRFSEVVSAHQPKGDAPMAQANGERRPLDIEIAAYQKHASELEASHFGKWALFKGDALIAIHDTFEATAMDAVEQFGRGPFLIRQIGAPPIVIRIRLIPDRCYPESLLR